jgi:hypothetical protein
MNTNKHEFVIRSIWPGSAGVPPAYDNKLAGETSAFPGANLRFAATNRDFTGPQANSFLQRQQILFCICGGFR